MDLRLEGKRVVVTGGGTGIGRATAVAFAREGARLCLVGRTAGHLDEVAAALDEVDGGHRCDTVDIYDGDAVDTFVARLASEWGGCDVLVNNACSLAAIKRVHDMDPGHWDYFVGGNLRGLFRLCRGLLPCMVEQTWGRVINVGSLTSELGSSHYADYATVKSAMLGLTRNLAVDYSRHGITVNTIQPGFIRTERFEAAAPPKYIETFKKATSLKRLGEPEEVADLIIFLASDRASYITGATIPIGGGAGLNNLW